MAIQCLACDLIQGQHALPGGRIYKSQYWVVEHCVGPLPLGTLIVKPFRHVTRLWRLKPEETQEMGPLLQKTTEALHALTKADQIYTCLWSHQNWVPGHLHFVLQPVWNAQKKSYAQPGPYLQVEYFEAAYHPQTDDIEELAEQLRLQLK